MIFEGDGEDHLIFSPLYSYRLIGLIGGKKMMIRADKSFLKQLEEQATRRKQEILHAPDCINVKGRVYYVSNDGSDENDGKTPQSAWKSLNRVSKAILSVGDGVLFRRGDIFRGCLNTAPGVTYAAYGSGEKPKFYGWDHSLADPSLWELFDETNHIWKLKERILDCGTLVFNDGEKHCRKLIPSYINGVFVCREDENRPFVVSEQMQKDLDLVCLYDDRLTTVPSKGQNFPIPQMDGESLGDLFLRCDAGNPAECFYSIEALPRRSMISVRDNANVTIDNLCLKYIGCHAVAAGGHVVGLHVSNCEIGWIGGAIQHYLGTDPNYPEGGRGTVTRFGNGIEIYGGCEDYCVRDCYIYQVYDAGITHQITTNGNFVKMEGIRYLNNLVEYCVYSIEYFLEKKGNDTKSYIDDCLMCGNILRFSGYGWGQQRHNTHTPAHIKGWSYENTARNYSIVNNLFDRAAYRMLHLVAREQSSCPTLAHNTYVQMDGMHLGQYGANAVEEPENMIFDEQVEEKLHNVVNETAPTVYLIVD